MQRQGPARPAGSTSFTSDQPFGQTRDTCQNSGRGWHARADWHERKLPARFRYDHRHCPGGHSDRPFPPDSGHYGRSSGEYRQGVLAGEPGELGAVHELADSRSRPPTSACRSGAREGTLHVAAPPGLCLLDPIGKRRRPLQASNVPTTVSCDPATARSLCCETAAESETELRGNVRRRFLSVSVARLS